MPTTSRYVGARPFETEHQHIFRGRTSDIQALLHLLQLEQLVLLYGKSGTGKSSLINAGLIPLILEKTDLEPVRIRFNAYKEGDAFISPISKTGQRIRGGEQDVATFLDKLLPNEESIWHHCKEHYIGHAGERTLLLIFDQFEELFTYPESMILAFQQQLAEALYRSAPQRYWDTLEELYGKGERPLTPAELKLLQAGSHVKVLFSIRSDRLHLLNRLTKYLPTVQKHHHELDAITPSSAREAILGPAVLPQGEHFKTPPFTYTAAALNRIIDFLTQTKELAQDDDAKPQKIEATQLQIICSSIEQKVANTRTQQIDEHNLGDLQAIIANYYDERIKALESEERLPARRLIEEGLIFDEGEGKGIRLSLYEGQIRQIYFIQAETLSKLVDSHLLRAEPSLAGGYTYELSHDTLVRPVLDAKANRLAEEAAFAAKIEREQREAELKRLRDEAEKEKQRAEEALLLRQEAVKQQEIAVHERAKALEQKHAAEEAQAEAERQREKAVAETQRANRLARRANIISLLVIVLGLLSFVVGIISRRNLQLYRKAEAKQDAYFFRDLTERSETLIKYGYVLSADTLMERAQELIDRHEGSREFDDAEQQLEFLRDLRDESERRRQNQ